MPNADGSIPNVTSNPFESLSLQIEELKREEARLAIQHDRTGDPVGRDDCYQKILKVRGQIKDVEARLRMKQEKERVLREAALSSASAQE